MDLNEKITLPVVGEVPLIAVIVALLVIAALAYYFFMNKQA